MKINTEEINNGSHKQNCGLASQAELEDLLQMYTDRFTRVNGRARLIKPYNLTWKGVNYVGAGSTYMHVLIPLNILCFEPRKYDQFNSMATLLDNLAASPNDNISVADLHAKMRGLYRFTRINGVSFHRKLIGKFWSFSNVMMINDWQHLTSNKAGANCFTAIGCYIVIAPAISDELVAYEDDIKDGDIPDFDTQTVEDLSPKQAMFLACRKQPIHLPELKSLSHDSAMRLNKHISFPIETEVFANSMFGEELWNENNIIHFGPKIKLPDEVLECFMDCYSDLVFDNAEMQLKYDQLKEKVLQSRILKRLDEVLFPVNNLRIIYSENDNGCAWTIADEIEYEDDLDFIGTDLNRVDETEFLTALFYRYEKYHLEKQAESLYPYRSYWTIDRENITFSNLRVPL